jgi:integrase
MTTVKAVIRTPRADGLYQVYIRIVHNRKAGYIKTEKFVTKDQLSKAGEINDPLVNEYCARLIREYTDRINRVDARLWTVQEVLEHVTKVDEDVNFSIYARSYIRTMSREGHDRNAKTYLLAVMNLERFLGSNALMFSMLTSRALTLWIKSMEKFKRCKEQYPTCVRMIYKKAMIELNDEERNIERIKFNPWLKVTIPKSDKAEKKAISAEECREFFNRPLPRTKMLSSLPELGRDVAMLILCLAGINTVDLFNLKKGDYHNGIIAYKRAKTKHARADEAYFEIKVEPFIKPIFDKYLDKTDSEYLLNFHQRYSDSDSFCANANNGIKKICADMGLPREQWYCCYTMRHSWATIAQNDCDANLYEVAFGMNHTHGLKVTRGYVKMDFTPAWNLNRKVIDFVFFSDARSKQGLAKDIEEAEGKVFRITQKMMIKGIAYFKGHIIGKVEDIGFNTVDDVVKALVKQFPNDLAEGCAVQFRFINKDNGAEVVYEHTKGKGF